MQPSHIAIIPDGNRRWAKANNKSLAEGYLAGIERVGNALEWSRNMGVRKLTFWGLSTENLSREERELKTLMRLFEAKLKESMERNEFHENGIRFRVFGDKSLLPTGIRKYISDLERDTRDYSNYFANVLLGYGGRQEILAACNSVLEDYSKGRVKQVDERTFQSYLHTAELGDPDLIIRTSGEKRLSGFLPWQSAYSEFYFSKKLWPDFTKAEMKKAVSDYADRERRFGR